MQEEGGGDEEPAAEEAPRRRRNRDEDAPAEESAPAPAPAPEPEPEEDNSAAQAQAEADEAERRRQEYEEEQLRLEQEKMERLRQQKAEAEAARRRAEEEAAAAAEAARQEEERLERERMEAEEAARVKAEEEAKKKKGKRKGLGGLSAEKKKMLKKLIMQKAAEDLRNEAKAKAAEKEKYINDRVAPLKTDGLDDGALQQLVKDLHAKVSSLEEDVYDWEIKIRKQDFEINELTLKVNDTKGKFIKPVLRKVNKTENKLKKIQVVKESTDFRGNLKSTGQNKYALEEEEPEAKVAWKDELKSKSAAEDAPAEDAPEDAAPAEEAVES